MRGSELFEAVQELESKLKCTTLMKGYSESRGHRKLRLSSRKHYETIKYSKPKSTKVQPVLGSLQLSFPLSIYCELVADSTELLLARVKKLNSLPEGSVQHYYIM